MKMKDKLPTKVGDNVRWVDAITGKSVVIGYNT